MRLEKVLCPDEENPAIPRKKKPEAPTDKKRHCQGDIPSGSEKKNNSLMTSFFPKLSYPHPEETDIPAFLYGSILCPQVSPGIFLKSQIHTIKKVSRVSAPAGSCSYHCFSGPKNFRPFIEKRLWTKLLRIWAYHLFFNFFP